MNKARYNEVLTEKAKVIFGDIVTKVFIVADEHEVERLDRCDYEVMSPFAAATIATN